MIVLVLLLPSFSVFAQKKELKIEDAIKIALQNNREIKAYSLKVDEQKTLISSAIAIDKTILTYGTDQNNIAANNHPLKVWGVTQNFSFPTLYNAEMKAKKIEHSIAETELKIQSENLIKQVSLNYLELQVTGEKLKIYQNIDSLYHNILQRATVRNNKGDISNLDLLYIKAKQQQIKHQLNSVKYDFDNIYVKLRTLMGYDSTFVVSEEIQLLNNSTRDIETTPFVLWLRGKEALSYANIGIEKNKLLPDISINYFLGTNFFENAKYYHGFEANLTIPIFYNAQKSRIKASKIAEHASRYFSEHEIELLKTKQKEFTNSQIKLKEQLDFYNESGIKLYHEIIRSARVNYESGEIDFFKFATSTETALQIKLDYLNNLISYTKVTLELNYLLK